MTEEKITDDRMAIVLRFVTMDIALPFYEPMGLELPDKRVFQTFLRRCISNIRKQFEEQGVTVPIVESIDKAIVDELGHKIRDKFFEWSVSTFSDAPQDHPHSLAWLFVISACASSQFRWNRLTLPDRLRESLRLEYRKMTDDGDISELQKKYQDEPLSEWDAEMYERHGFHDPAIDPYDWFANTAARHRFQKALEKLVSHLNPFEVEEFRASVSRIALEDGYSDVKELKGPHELREPVY